VSELTAFIILTIVFLIVHLFTYVPVEEPRMCRKCGQVYELGRLETRVYPRLCRWCEDEKKLKKFIKRRLK
jgi:hypothetical protein